MSQPIPIANLYYLLCYAWDKLAEKDIVAVDPLQSTELLDLFARVLASGTRHLVRRGFDRGYVEYGEWIPAVRGRLVFAERARRPAPSATVPCQFDELSYDVQHNRILKTTLVRLSRVLKGDTAEGLAHLSRLLSDVQEIEIDNASFARVRLNRNNQFYDFLLKVCQLVHEGWLPSEGGATSRFRDFEREDKQMAKVYEAFVHNFYARHSQLRVGRQDLKWDWVPGNEHAARLLPKMQTDISLRGPREHIVIECKYTPRSTQSHYDVEKLRSSHLYQVYAYLSNLPPAAPEERCEMILLYPKADEHLDLAYHHRGWTIRVQTLDLSQSWKGIHSELLGLIAGDTRPSVNS